MVRADAKTGRLVRRVSAPAVKAAPAELNGLIERIAGEHGVEAPLVHSVIRAESNYNTTAVSPKGALGLMQLMPSTARRFGVTDAFNVADNIQGGVRYLRFLLDYYRGDYVRAIAAYNAGETAVDQYKGVPPYSETRNYVHAVALNLEAARARQAAIAPPATPRAAAPAVSGATGAAVIAVTGPDGRIYYRTP